jgi:hypothetical protein
VPRENKEEKSCHDEKRDDGNIYTHSMFSISPLIKKKKPSKYKQLLCLYFTKSEPISKIADE